MVWFSSVNRDPGRNNDGPHSPDLICNEIDRTQAPPRTEKPGTRSILSIAAYTWLRQSLLATAHT
jgi:hypothetical protein